MIKVSIVVPVYNCEEYLERCVKSLLGQSLKEIEIILIDDGSKDASFEICQKLSGRYANVKVKHIENSGAAKARIEGIKMATGEYIGFLDSDDWAADGMYETLYAEAKRLDADIIQCSYKKVGSEGEKIVSDFEQEKTRIYSAENSLMQLLGVDKESEFNFLLWNKIYKTDIFKKIQLPTHIKTNNDVPVIPRVFYGAKKIAVTDTQYVYYFMRNNEQNKSISDELRTSEEKLIWSHIKAFNDISLYFKELNEKMYLASLRYTISWSLSALKRHSVSKECKADARKVIKSSKIIGNRYIPLKKKIVAICFQIVSRFEN